MRLSWLVRLPLQILANIGLFALVFFLVWCATCDVLKASDLSTPNRLLVLGVSLLIFISTRIVALALYFLGIKGGYYFWVIAIPGVVIYYVWLGLRVAG